MLKLKVFNYCYRIKLKPGLENLPISRVNKNRGYRGAKIVKKMSIKTQMQKPLYLGNKVRKSHKKKLINFIQNNNN